MNELRYEGRAWAKGFALHAMRAKYAGSRLGARLEAGLAASDAAGIAAVAVEGPLLGEMPEESRYDELEAGVWRACGRDEALTWARAFQRRRGCPASAQALAGIEALDGAWGILDTGAVAVVTEDCVALFFDAG